LARLPWLQPWAITHSLELRLATSCTVVETDDGVVLVDPFCTFGDGSDVGRRVELLAAAGVAVDDVAVVVLTHVDGPGLCVDGDGAPVFESARVLAPAADLAAIAAGAWQGLEPLLHVAAPHIHLAEVAPGVSLVDLPGHQDGHAGVAIGDPWEVLVTGHLFIHPSQTADPDAPGLDDDVPAAAATRRSILARAADEGFALLGPLWPQPGAAAVSRSDDGFLLHPLAP
jgi:glyoxylase-like metal-dependent hydrolase (beta-lactamase superfamily II)